MVWAYILGILGIAGTFVWDVWFDVDYERAANISLIYFAFITTVFVLLYGFRSKWWTNRVGKIFFVKAVILPLVLWQVAASVWLDADYPFRNQVRFALYTLAPVAYVVMVIVLHQQQRGDRRRKVESNKQARPQVLDTPNGL